MTFCFNLRAMDLNRDVWVRSTWALCTLQLQGICILWLAASDTASLLTVFLPLLTYVVSFSRLYRHDFFRPVSTCSTSLRDFVLKTSPL